jgi:hypothetical protein
MQKRSLPQNGWRSWDLCLDDHREDLQAAIDNSGVCTETIAVDIHAGFTENIDGVLATLRPAAEIGWISSDELARQQELLKAANQVERLRGAAVREYIEPSRGDLKHKVAERLITLMKEEKRVLPL